MSHCVISAQYPPQIDITKTPLAYGHGALPRLVSKMRKYLKFFLFFIIYCTIYAILEL